jgi:hypothetical protein
LPVTQDVVVHCDRLFMQKSNPTRAGTPAVSISCALIHTYGVLDYKISFVVENQIMGHHVLLGTKHTPDDVVYFNCCDCFDCTLVVLHTCLITSVHSLI